jgi:hypothetical protein
MDYGKVGNGRDQLFGHVCYSVIQSRVKWVLTVITWKGCHTFILVIYEEPM